MSRIPPAARAVWFDLAARSERMLVPGDPLPEPQETGFLWVDVELPAPEAIASLVAAGVLPADAAVDDPPTEDVSSRIERDHVHLGVTGVRLRDSTLVLDRRGVLITERAVVSLHRGRPGYVEELRSRYRDDFARFARSRGFLLFEIFGHLVDELQGAVRVLGDRIDGLRVEGVRSSGPREDDPGAELLSSVLLLRRILVRTRELLSELSSRRSVFIPETTQPYLRDMANRLDGTLADLAFSRDVLSEALRTPTGAASDVGAPPEVAEARQPTPSSARPPLTIRSLGAFDVQRGDDPIPFAAFGQGAGRQLLAALLCARRPVPREELVHWIWPELAGERALRALRVALSGLSRALEPDLQPGARSTIIDSEAGAYRIALTAADRWDAPDLLAAAGRAATTADLEQRIELLSRALDSYRGPLFPEWPYADWSGELRLQCERAHRSVLAAAAETLLELGRAGEALGHFESLLTGDPECERWHRGMMRSYFLVGDRALALRQYHTCRSVLRQSRGVEPGPETNALYMQLLRPG
jgi:magnesium transporter